MLLESQDVELFFKLHRSLMFFVNQRLKVVPDEIAGPDAFAALSPQVRLKVGPGIRRSMNESFKEAKARHGIVTSLPMSDGPLPVKAPKARPVLKPPSREEKDEVLHVI